MSTGTAIERFVLNQVKSFGSDIIQVEIRAPGLNNAIGINVTTLKESDAISISELPNIGPTYAGVLSQSTISYQGTVKNSMIFAVTADYLSVDEAKIASGRFYTDQENTSLARVVVIGSGVAESFFGSGSDPVNEFIRINSQNYRVVGVIEKRGAAGFFDRDNLVYIPLKTVQKLIDGTDHITFIISKLIDSEKVDETKIMIEELLRDRHKITDPDKDDFSVVSIEEAEELVQTVLSAMKLLLLALAGISLVVGGVGIMNIMYVSVSERTYEIGLRKAIGARSKDILLQFLAEAVIMTLIGGVVGIFLGSIFSYLIALFIQSKGFDWEFVVTPVSVLTGVGFSVLVGVVFGLYPAKKAAKLNPIEALRYE